jgi:tetratricopeptide (TPR) repeat protein
VQALLAAGDLERAAAEAQDAIAAGASRAEGLALLGEIFLRQGAFGEALDRFRQARELDGSLRDALAGEVRALVQLGRGADASEAAETLLSAAPGDVDTMLLAARVRSAASHPERALELLDIARHGAPMRADVLKQIGDVARAMGDAARAIDAYRHAVSLDGDLATARLELAALYAARGATAEAEAELEAALASLPTYVDAALQLAALRRLLGRPGETVALLVGVLQRDPWHLDALCSLGESLFLCGEREDARAAFARVLRFDPEHVGALYFDGVLLAEERRYEAAMARWARVVELEPAGEHARRARRDTRTAMDLQRIFAAQDRRGGERRPAERRGAA